MPGHTHITDKIFAFFSKSYRNMKNREFNYVSPIYVPFLSEIVSSSTQNRAMSGGHLKKVAQTQKHKQNHKICITTIEIIDCDNCAISQLNL